jgi:hypothetical protein
MGCFKTLTGFCLGVFILFASLIPVAYWLQKPRYDGKINIVNSYGDAEILRDKEHGMP